MNKLNLIKFLPTIFFVYICQSNSMEMGRTNLKSIQINTQELQQGDILIITDTRNFKKKSLTANSFIKSGQKLQSYFSQGDSNAVHASIISIDNENNLKIAEVTGKGAHLSEIQEKYPYNIYVFRSIQNSILMKNASQIALEETKKDTINYSKSMAIHSIVFPKLILPHHFSSNKITNNNFCSKFIIECIQLSSQKLKEMNILTPECKTMSESFNKEKTSSVKSLMDYLISSKQFTYFLIPSNEKIFEDFLPALTTELHLMKDKYPMALTKLEELLKIIDQKGLVKKINEIDLALIILNNVLFTIKDKDIKRKLIRLFNPLGISKFMLNNPLHYQLYYELFEDKTQNDIDLLGVRI